MCERQRSRNFVYLSSCDIGRIKFSVPMSRPKHLKMVKNNTVLDRQYRNAQLVTLFTFHPNRNDACVKKKKLKTGQSRKCASNNKHAAHKVVYYRRAYSNANKKKKKTRESAVVEICFFYFLNSAWRLKSGIIRILRRQSSASALASLV